MFNSSYYSTLRARQEENDSKSEAKQERVSAAQNGDDETDQNLTEPMPETVVSDMYIPGYLMHQIGKYMRVEFLIGNNTTDRNGRLVQVGASFIILQPQNGDLIVCDLFSVKFIVILADPTTLL